MKYFILILLLSFSCKSKEPDVVVPKDDFFETTKLLSDSLNIFLKMNVPIDFKTTKGDISIRFSGYDLCPQSDCSTCDPEAPVRIYLKHKLDSMQVKTMYIYRCSQRLPILYKTAKCVFPYVISGEPIEKYGNLIFSVKELAPYAKTSVEVQDFYKNNKYTLSLTILNACD